MMSSSLALQETITYSAEKKAYVLDKVEDTNAYLGVTNELSRKPLGNISQLSCRDHDFDEYQYSFSSDSLQDNKISPTKLTSQKRTDNEIVPSLLATGASKPVGDISSMDT